jgi:hypothetical protein
MDTCDKAYTVLLELRFIHIPKSVSAFTLHPHPPLIYGADCRDHSVHVRSVFFITSVPFSTMPHSRYSIDYTLVNWEWIQVEKTHFTCKTQFFRGTKTSHYFIPRMLRHVLRGALMTSAASVQKHEMFEQQERYGPGNFTDSRCLVWGWKVNTHFVFNAVRLHTASWCYQSFRKRRNTVFLLNI